jgi:hypothetical protein
MIAESPPSPIPLKQGSDYRSIQAEWVSINFDEVRPRSGLLFSLEKRIDIRVRVLALYIERKMRDTLDCKGKK